MLNAELSRTILSLHTGVRDQRPENFRRWALDQITKLFSFDSAMWGSATNAPRRMHEVFVLNQPQAMLENYARYEEHDILRTAVCAHPGRTVNLADLMSPKEWEETEIYRNHASRYGICAVLCTVDIEPITGLINVISLWRKDLHNPFTERERQIKEFLAPHLFATCRQNRFLCMQNTRRDGKDPLDAPAICDHMGVLHQADSRFVTLVATEWPAWSGARLPQILAKHITKNRDKPYLGRRIYIRTRRIGSLYFLESRARKPVDDLTLAERTVATHYADGLTYKEIAQNLQLSPTTIKAHLRNIYGKLKVTNKAQLINLVAPNT